jgi:hypothetical protein
MGLHPIFNSLLAEKEVIIGSYGLTHSQKWPVGFGPSGEMVFYPLSVCHPDMKRVRV